MANSYEPPNWAGKPPTGLHLDVLKEDKLIQKLMIDEKKFYLFGRNAQMNDFCIDHASCSRVHAAFLYHKHLNIAYLVDLGSTHGTFIGTLRLEPHKPTQLQINSTFHFGASTRRYILRERPSVTMRSSILEEIPLNESSEGALLGLPETQNEVDNLTEYNTAHNRRISMLGITDDNIRKQSQIKNPRKRKNVTFNDEEIIINPEDIDPNVGRFRNLVQTTVVPTKKLKIEHGIPTTSTSVHSSISHVADVKHMHPSALIPSLYHGLPAAISDHQHNPSSSSSGTSKLLDVDVVMGTKLGLLLPNPAPDVNPETSTPPIAPSPFPNNAKGRFEDRVETSSEPQKKKYAKEAWPGRKPMLGSL
ncbi:nuclear inhibitor of protein phosphatase 1 [Condylostylus longicornis]|uniref:nuclear inhibitor of protein phosphatase 1 n=1 Tax=Condylostylus longicornis TaxID=2530218 RepID=UPI00244DDC33|nr:nuclear inhibitor of protein phosphatase 1 [Condylostylus longicornis]XP_055390401.1 nuclear inhibitor of protein phosphatase 1 [Condylostylus longicornis]